MIENHPKLRIRALFRKPGNCFSFLPPRSSVHKFNYARTALFEGIKLLKTEKKTVLVPSYNCGDEIEAIIQAGCRVEFYSVDENLMLDLKYIESRINENTLALHITHFNGFPQPVKEIRKFCNKHEIFLIEDCAHVLITSVNDAYLGSFGDIAVFSPRKYLPIRNGGLLVVNNSYIEEKPGYVLKNSYRKLFSDFKYYTKTWIKDHIIGNKERALESISYNTNYNEAAVAISDFKFNNYGGAITPFSGYCLSRLGFRQIIENRRRNYHFYIKNISVKKSIRPLQAIIPEGVCPLFFLVVVDNPWHLGKYLLENRISTTVFWSLFHEQTARFNHKDSVFLKKHVLALPLHQDISLKDLKHIVEVINNYNGN